MRAPSFRFLADLVTTLVMLAVAGITIVTLVNAREAPRTRSRDSERLPEEPVSIDGAAILGDSNASAGIIVFSDFECPYCGRFAREVLPILRERYVTTRRAFLAFRHLPLERIHRSAFAAAVAAECAGQQGQFWPMHDLLFADPQELQHADRLALRLPMDMPAFHRCVGGPVGSDVRLDMAEAKKLLVTGTPTVFIGAATSDRRIKVSKRLKGSVPFDQFDLALKAVLEGLNPSAQ